MSLARCCSRASRKCRTVWTVTRLFYSSFGLAVKTTKSIVAACFHNRAEIKADVNAQVFSRAELGFRCLGIMFSNPLRPTRRQDRCTSQTGDDDQLWLCCDPEETCRVIGGRKQILTTKDIPAHEADTLDDRFGELVECSDNFVGVLFRCGGLYWRGARLGCSTESSISGLDRRARLGGSFGFSTLHELDWFTRGSDADFSFPPRRLERCGLWCGGSSGIH